MPAQPRKRGLAASRGGAANPEHFFSSRHHLSACKKKPASPAKGPGAMFFARSFSRCCVGRFQICGPVLGPAKGVSQTGVGEVGRPKRHDFVRHPIMRGYGHGSRWRNAIWPIACCTAVDSTLHQRLAAAARAGLHTAGGARPARSGGNTAPSRQSAPACREPSVASPQMAGSGVGRPFFAHDRSLAWGVVTFSL